MAWCGGKFQCQDKTLPGYYFRLKSGSSGGSKSGGGNSGGGGSGGGGDTSGFTAYFIDGTDRMAIEGECVGCTEDGCLTINNDACVCAGDGCLTITTA